jgi:DNA processing protein
VGSLKYWLWLSGQTGLSCRCKASVIGHFQDAERAFFAPAGEFETIPGVNAAEAAILEKRELSHAERILADCRQQGIDIITMQDARYPKWLKNIFAPPVVLYVKGRLPDVDNLPAIAVIGTRKASAYGLKMGRNLSYEISRSGGIVISLLTEGVDRETARGCLMAGGCCIGVLGTAHEKENALHRDIIASGALVSEYPPGIKQQKFFFKERKKIFVGYNFRYVGGFRCELVFVLCQRSFN